MKPLFSLPDILDLEFLFKRDEPRLEQGDDTELRRRDRAIYIATGLDVSAEPSTPTLAGHWLCARRQEYQRQQLPLPGQIWQEATSLSAGLLLLLSLLAGSGLAASFLRYDGTTPVNVSGFFAIFILVQLLLVILNLGLFGYRLLRQGKGPKSVLYTLLTRALARLFTSLFRRSQKHLPATRRLDLQAASGSLQQLRQIYGNLLLWPAFILLQLAGSGFNLGVLLTLLAKISFTDIAFGWQSTLPLTDLFLAELVRWIALPWAWLLPAEWAYPGLEQIIGSKIVLIEGYWRLTSAGLTSWWPFLLCGVLIYGLLPRLLLLGWGSYRLRAGLKQLPCDSAAFRQLRRRMLTPLVQTEAQQQIPPPAARQQPTPAPGLRQTALTGSGHLLIIPDELWDLCPVDLLAPHLAELDKNSPLIPLRHGAIMESSGAFLDQVSNTLKAHDLAGIVVLQEAWQPPIREITTLLRHLRWIIGSSSPLSIALIGKPAADKPLTPVQSQDLTIWLKTTKALADPYLDVFPLVRN
ncbi:MAG: DUF2868 domain-containing protein [Desulfuromonadales bacterium]|nr:DUF2868 domain-containing protein [Desulfuromonadales bacterium]